MLVISLHDTRNELLLQIMPSVPKIMKMKILSNTCMKIKKHKLSLETDYTHLITVVHMNIYVHVLCIVVKTIIIGLYHKSQ